MTLDLLAARDLEFLINLSEGNSRSIVDGLSKALNEVLRPVEQAGEQAGQGWIAKFLGAAVGGQGKGGRLGQIGGLIGGAAGGPAGAVVGGAIGEKAGDLAGLVPNALTSPLSGATKLFGTLGNALSTLSSTLGPINLGFDALGASLQTTGDFLKKIPGLGTVLGPAVDSLTALPGIFKGITETLTSFAAKASPATFKLFQIAVDDVQATIGQAFVPVLELMTDGVRLFGDVLANILPNMGEVRAALSEAREAFSGAGSAIRDALNTVGPVIRNVFIGAIMFMGKVLAQAAGWIQQFAKQLGIAFAGSPLALGQEGDRTSVGAAARPTAFSGFEEYQRQLQLEAFKQPGKETKQDQSFGHIAEVRNFVEEIWNWLQGHSWSEIFDILIDKLKELISRNTPNSGASHKAAQDVLKDPKSTFNQKVGAAIFIKANEAVGGGTGSLIGGSGISG